MNFLSELIGTRWSSMANRRSECLHRKSAFDLAVTFTFDLLTSKYTVSGKKVPLDFLP